MQATTPLFRHILCNLFVVNLLCFTLFLLSGCDAAKPKNSGGTSGETTTAEVPDVPLTSEEQTEADRIITDTGNTALLQFLLAEKGAEERKDPKRVLQYVKYFVEQGSNVNATTLNNSTPLFRAVEINNVEVVKFLVSKGADPLAKDTDGFTPFHVAAVMGNIPIAEFLLTRGADVNGGLKWGDTPLHLAARAAHLEFAKFLVSKGAEVNAKNSSGITPLKAAEARDSSRLRQSPEIQERIKATVDYLSGLQ